MKKLSLMIIGLILVFCLAVETAFCTEGSETEQESNKKVIMTVRGPIEPTEFGKALAHEHVMVDFIGAARTGRHRYNRDEVVAVMLPYVQAVREREFSGFVDCTPAWLGRDVEVLRRLAELTDMHIVTNTGYYGTSEGKFLPSHAFTETAEQLASRWVAEWEEGIEGTGIKPGFIKISVNKGRLSKTDEKLVEAAAKTHLQTGLTIACHTGEARAALGLLAKVRAEGVSPSALIIVHADGIANEDVHFELAKSGAWVEYDAVSDTSIKKHVRLIRAMLEAGYGEQLLVSHDAGWYAVGEGKSGLKKIRPFTTIADTLIPALKSAGVSKAEVEKLFVENPARAFSIGVRKM